MKYKKGDVIVNRYGGKRKVLEVYGCLYFLCLTDSESYAETYTEKDLDEYGFKLDVPEWKPEKLKKGDEYWIIDSTGSVGISYYGDSEGHKYRLKTGNVYGTEQEAQEALDKIMNS